MSYIRPQDVPPGIIVWLPNDLKGPGASPSEEPTVLYDRSEYSHVITQDLKTAGGIYLTERIGGRGVLLAWNPARAGGSGPAAAHISYLQSRIINLQPNAVWGPGYDGSFSISFWIKSTESSGSASTATTSDNNPFVCSKFAGGGSGDAARRFRVNIRGASSGEVQFTIGGTSSNVMVESSTGVTDDVFHHVVCVRDVTSGDTRIYIDGVSDANSTLVAGHDSYNTNDLAIGGPNDLETGSGAEVDGWIGDFRIYNRALTNGEVWMLYDHRTRFREVITEDEPEALYHVFAAGADDVQSPPTPKYSFVSVVAG